MKIHQDRDKLTLSYHLGFLMNVEIYPSLINDHRHVNPILKRSTIMELAWP